MQLQLEHPKRTATIHFNDLPFDIFSQVVRYLDVFTLCCLYLTQKTHENQDIQHSIYQQFSNWCDEFAPYNKLTHEQKRLFILASSYHPVHFARNRFVFNKANLQLRSNDNTLETYVLKKNNPQLNTFVFNQLVNDSSIDAKSLLIWAVKLNQANEWIEKQLQKADLRNTKFPDGSTLLFSAVAHNAIHIAEILLKHGCKPNETAGGKPAPIVKATSEGLELMVKLLLRYDASVEVTNEEGLTPLCVASEEGYLNIATLLIEHRANVNFQNTDGKSPLHYAIEAQKADVVDLLLLHGVNADLRTEKGLTALHLGAYKGLTDSVKKILAFYKLNKIKPNEITTDTATPLYIAACNGHHELCRVLLEQEADVSLKFKGLFSPLYAATVHGHLETVKFLINFDSDYETTKCDGYTILYGACDKGFLEIVLFLCSKFEDIDIECSDGWWPLIIACNNGHLEVVKCLLMNGALLEKQNQKEKLSTPLAFAAQAGQLEVLEFLIAQGANIHSRSNDGYTPLHFACAKKEPNEEHLAVIMTLVNQGADCLSQTNKGKTPLQLATNPEIIKIMQRYERIAAVKNKLPANPMSFFSEPKLIEQPIKGLSKTIKDNF